MTISFYPSIIDKVQRTTNKDDHLHRPWMSDAPVRRSVANNGPLRPPRANKVIVVYIEKGRPTLRPRRLLRNIN